MDPHPSPWAFGPVDGESRHTPPSTDTRELLLEVLGTRLAEKSLGFLDRPGPGLDD
jgi:hypothetical protein